MTTTDLPAGDHELVQLVRDDDLGLLGVIAVHSTALGPAMGGVRRTAYASVAEAVADAKRLSAAMTLKNSAAGLPLGGGKSVIVDVGAELSDSVLDAFAEAIEQLGGRYVAAEDIGTSPAHMDRIARSTRWVAGQSPSSGGNGDPSPTTADTVFGALRAAAAVRWGTAELAGRRVGVLGVGKVGGRLAELAARAGANVTVADLDQARAEAVSAALSAEVVSPSALLEHPLDVLAPCARGGVLSLEVASALRCQIVCGAANNILASDDVADRLEARGVLYVPDFLANAGGIIHVGGAFLGWDAERIHTTVQDCIERVGAVLLEAQRRGVTALQVAYERAQARLGSPGPLSGAAIDIVEQPVSS